MSHLKILLDRFIRVLINKDPYCPHNCYVGFYSKKALQQSSKKIKCDCINFCKFPPPGPPMYIPINTQPYNKSRINMRQ